MAEVKVDFRADTRDFQRGMKSAADSVDGLSREMKDSAQQADRFDRSIDDVSDGLGNGAQKFRDTNDLISGFADVVGLSLPPQAGMIMGFADMADGLGGLLAPALGKARAAMLAMNTAIAANPIGAAVLAIAALTAAFVIAYKKSETFRDIVHGALSGVKTAAITLRDTFVGVAKVITAPYRAAFNGIASAWNNTVGKLSFSVPNWVPIFGGNGWDVPDIPMLAKGGTALAGRAHIVGEQGPELFVPGVTGTVVPNSALGGSAPIHLTINQYDEAGALKRTIQKIVRTEGGGDVQATFGRA